MMGCDKAARLADARARAAGAPIRAPGGAPDRLGECVLVALEFEQRDGAELIAVTGEVAYIANFEDKVGYDRDAKAAELSPLLWEGNLQLPDGAVVQTCSGFGCGKRESRPHEFERCGRCRRAVYCSRECQRKNWKAFHKGVCSRFVEIAPLARPLRAARA